MSANIIEWREPSPQKRGRKSLITPEMLQELQSHPGKWGVIMERPFNDKNKKKVTLQLGGLARSANVRLREQGYHFTCRQEEDDKVVMFGRFAKDN